MHLEERSRDFIHITPYRIIFFRDFSTMLSIGISVVVTSFYKYDKFEREDGSFTYTCKLPQIPNTIMEYLGYS